jgi:hypothetical protein
MMMDSGEIPFKGVVEVVFLFFLLVLVGSSRQKPYPTHADIVHLRIMWQLHQEPVTERYDSWICDQIGSKELLLFCEVVTLESI